MRVWKQIEDSKGIKTNTQNRTSYMFCLDKTEIIL